MGFNGADTDLTILLLTEIVLLFEYQISQYSLDGHDVKGKLTEVIIIVNRLIAIK